MKEGWEYKKLKEVGLTQTGTTPSKQIKAYYGGDIPFIRPAELNVDQNGGVQYDSELKLTEEGALKSRVIKANSVLMCCIGSVGKTGYTLNNVTCNQQINTLTPYDNYNPRFVYYALISPFFQQEVINIANSAKATLPIISKGKWEILSIPVPPLSEQQSIVDYLDSAFAKIDAMKANAEKALNEAKALFQASLKEMLEPKEGWEEKTLKDVSVIYGNYGLSVPSAEYNGVRYLRITDITEWGDLNDEKVSAKLDEEKEQELLEEGDILFARTGATVGKTLMYKEAFGKCLFAGYLIRYRINKEIVLPKFIFYITHSANYYKWVLENQKAAAQPNISAKLYNEYVLSFPSLSEQQTIVDTLDSLKFKVDKLQENYNKISQECDALKQAILRQVFE
ncbi:restriction endonuclease subunit S [uncultured Prevotella sp.]|uniref:restriction endonuclease subunit S n=1 Tax=uncultured Prevotella sp. TaxID=159272 RepID=UPI00258F6FA3|nr:restriction endonuclease subunit S [uncultured Prevotella sp.]